MEIIQHVQNVQYGYLLNKYKMGHLEGNFTPVLYMGRKVHEGQIPIMGVGCFPHTRPNILTDNTLLF